MALFVCDQCRLSMNVSDDFANRQTKCPQCGKVSMVCSAEVGSPSMTESETNGVDQPYANENIANPVVDEAGIVDDDDHAPTTVSSGRNVFARPSTESKGNAKVKVSRLSEILLFVNWLVVIVSVLSLTNNLATNLAMEAITRERFRMEKISENEIVAATVIYLSRIVLAYILGRSIDKILRLFK